jgi:hypothetical protein
MMVPTMLSSSMEGTLHYQYLVLQFIIGSDTIIQINH